MDTAAYNASASQWQPRIFVFLAITILASGCSNFLRPSQPEDLSPETQARVASSLRQNPPSGDVGRYPRGVPYQSLSNEERRLLETEVIPSLYESPPPAPASEPSPAAIRPTTSATPGRRRPQPGWTPYRQLSAEEQAFLEQEVMPRLMPETASPPAQQRATATVSRPAPSAPVTAPATTTPAEQPAEQATAATAPAETPPPDTTPQTATAPGPRRDKLDDATEDLPGPRVEKLESTTRAPDEAPILPAPQTVPEPTTPTPTPQQPVVPATPTGDTDTQDPPRPGAMPQAGEAVASADDDTEN